MLFFSLCAIIIIANDFSFVKRKENKITRVLKEGETMSDEIKIKIDADEIIKAKRAYKKAWRAKNKEKVKAANERFYKKLAERIAAEQEAERAGEQEAEPKAV